MVDLFRDPVDLEEEWEQKAARAQSVEVVVLDGGIRTRVQTTVGMIVEAIMAAGELGQPMELDAHDHALRVHQQLGNHIRSRDFDTDLVRRLVAAQTIVLTRTLVRTHRPGGGEPFALEELIETTPR